MEKITSQNAMELEVHRFGIDASDLGIRPGAAYPKTLPTNLGNGQSFLFHKFDGNGIALYRQELGCLTLEVFND